MPALVIRARLCLLVPVHRHPEVRAKRASKDARQQVGCCRPAILRVADFAYGEIGWPVALRDGASRLLRMTGMGAGHHGKAHSETPGITYPPHWQTRRVLTTFMGR